MQTQCHAALKQDTAAPHLESAAPVGTKNGARSCVTEGHSQVSSVPLPLHRAPLATPCHAPATSCHVAFHFAILAGSFTQHVSALVNQKSTPEQTDENTHRDAVCTQLRALPATTTPSAGTEPPPRAAHGHPGHSPPPGGRQSAS